MTANVLTESHFLSTLKGVILDLLGIQTYSVQGQYRNRQSLVPHNLSIDSLNLNRMTAASVQFLRCPAPFLDKSCSEEHHNPVLLCLRTLSVGGSRRILSIH